MVQVSAAIGVCLCVCFVVCVWGGGGMRRTPEKSRRLKVHKHEVILISDVALNFDLLKFAMFRWRFLLYQY